MLHVGKTFYYRGCGWRPKKMGWTTEDKAWIKRMIKLFDDLFGPDFCQFEDTETKHRILVPGQLPVRMYDHNEWEKNAGEVMVKDDGDGEDDSTTKESVNAETVKKVNMEDDAQEADYRKAQQTENAGIVNAEEAQDHHNSVKQTGNAETVNVEEAQEVDDSTAKQTDNADIVGEQDDRTSKQSQRNKNAESDLARFSDLKNLTRAELAALKLPDVAFITENEVTVFRPQTTSVDIGDPILATQRPGEAILQHACRLLQASTRNNDCVDSEDEDEDEVIVNLGRIGCYTKKGIQVFQTMCRLSAEAGKVNEERKWLSQTTSVPGVSMVEELLFNSRPHDEVSRHREFILDVSDFSTLACERYVNGFTIDVVSFKFLERTKHAGIIYLPSFSQLWAKQGVEFFKHKVNSIFSQCQVADAKCILTPVHFERPQHWGLLCFDVCSKTVFFDDGLKISLQSDTLHIVQNMLRAFRAMSDGAISEQHWNKSCFRLPLPRINMPTQPKSGIGAGSCGVGVMLAIRDIIASGNCCPTFNWRFDNMGYLRKELMALIARWRNEEASICIL